MSNTKVESVASAELAATSGTAQPDVNPTASTQVPKSFHNPANRLDVNADGRVSPLDALCVINELNRVTTVNVLTEAGTSAPDGKSVSAAFLDVNDDGHTSPIDALFVINYLNLGTQASREVPTHAVSLGFQNGLDDWDIEEVGGQAPYQGTVRVGSAILTEGNSFFVSIDREIVIPESPLSLTFIYEDDFDTSDQGFMRDAFEATLVGKDGTTLVHSFAPDRESFFNLTEGLNPAVGKGVTVESSAGHPTRVTLDLSQVFAGTIATLQFRLINNDADIQSTVRILDVIVTSQGDQPPAVSVQLANDTAPAGASTSLQNDRLTNDPRIIGTALDDQRVTKLEVAVDNSSFVDITSQLTADQYAYDPGQLDAGPHRFTVRATDTVGQTQQAILDIQVNRPPVAHAGSDQRTVQEGTLTLDGTLSSDAEADVYSYQWTLPDGSVVNGSAVQATFTQLGINTVTLTAVDTAGSVATDTVQVDVLRTLSPRTVLDDGAWGYRERGIWNPGTIQGGWQNDYRYQLPGTGSRTASWVTRVASGTYDIYASWVPHDTHATNATYRVLDGSTLRGTSTVNQQLSPGDGMYQGQSWRWLGRYQIATGVPTVELSDKANGRVVADGILFAPVGSPLLAGNAPITPTVHAQELRQAELQPIVDTAVERLKSSTVTAATLPPDLDFQIVDLPGSQLGFTSGNQIWIDTNAAGHGWFVDATPRENEEFQETLQGGLIAVDGNTRARFDLLTVVSHELGHVLGYDDLHATADSQLLMSEQLDAGVRREVDTVTPSNATGTATPGDAAGTRSFVVDNQADAVFRYGADGGLRGDFDLRGGVTDPRGIASNVTGDTLWTIDGTTHAVRVQGPGGEGEAEGEGECDADLTIANLDASGLVYDGQLLWVSGTISATIANLGSAEVHEPFEVLFYEDRDRDRAYSAQVDQRLGSVLISDPLAPAESRVITAPISGSVQFLGNVVWGMVDSHNNIPEGNEGNNLSRTVSVVAAGDDPSLFSPQVEWRRETFEVFPESNQVIMTPAVIDLNADGVPEVIVSTFTNNVVWEDGILRALDGRDGSVVWSVTNPAWRVVPGSHVAVGDLDLDGRPEIVAVHESSGLIVFEHDGSFKWRSEAVWGASYGGGPSLADLDGDCVPEIVFGGTALDNEGRILWRGDLVGGQGSGQQGPYAAISVVADIDLDGFPEVVAGKSAYRHDGTLAWNAPIPDGYAGIGNFDADPYAEIAVVSQGNVYLLDHLGAIAWGSVVHGGGLGGPPTIADFDGDGMPEIGVAGLYRYTVLETDGTVKWQVAIQENSAALTASSAFDFDGDGRVEIVYGDEDSLDIYNGVDGTIRYTFDRSNDTVTEYPVIVDVDGDGQAEIITVANNYIPYVFGTTGVYVLGNANENWVSTRRIWNQHSYHVTNINDDGTIPAREESSWLVHNTYRLNAELEASPLDAPDLTASFLRASGTDQQATLEVRIGNGGARFVPSGTLVAFYDDDPDQGGQLLGVTAITRRLNPGEYEDISLVVPHGDLRHVWAVADDDGTGQGQIRESNEENNRYHAVLTARAPDVTVLTPRDGVVATAGQEILISGRAVAYRPELGGLTAPSNHIVAALVNGVAVDVLDAAGNFFTRVPVQLGRNTYTVVALDANGQEGAATVVVDGHAASSGPDFLLYSDVTGSVRGEYGRTSYNEQHTLLFADLALRNAGTYMTDAPLLVGVTNLSDPTVRVHDADGTTLAGVPYYDFSSLVSGGKLAAGAATDGRTISFFNPSGEQFTYELVVLGVLNRAPEIRSVPDVEALVGKAYRYDVAAADPDGDPISYALVTAPAGMAIDRASGVVTWSPAAADRGSHSIAVRVEDGRGGASEQRYVLAAIDPPPNRPPVFTSVPIVEAIVEASYGYRSQAMDTDGDPLTYALTTSSDGLSIDASSGQLSWKPIADQIGDHTVAIQVDDGRGGTATQEFLVRVGADPNNHPPVIVSQPVTQFTLPSQIGGGGLESGHYSHTVQALDPDGDSLTYSLRRAPVGASIDAHNGQIIWLPTTPGDSAFTVRVEDGRGGFDQQDFAVQVFAADAVTGEIEGSVFEDRDSDGQWKIRDSLFATSFEDKVYRYDAYTGQSFGIFSQADALAGANDVTIGPDGNLYVAGFESGNIVRFDGETGAFIDVFASIPNAASLVFGPDGNLYVTSYETDSVERFDGSTGVPMGSFASGHGLRAPAGLTFGPDGNLYVANYGYYYSDDVTPDSGAVLRFHGVTGEFIDVFVAANSGNLKEAADVDFGPDGHLYVCDYGYQLGPPAIRRYDGVSGQPLGQFNSSDYAISRAIFLAFGPDGNVYLSTVWTANIVRYDGLTGQFLDVFVPHTGDGQGESTGFVFTVSSEPGLAAWTVYLDQNQNGRRDPGEQYTTTDGEGNYTLGDLPTGNFTVAVEGKPGWQQTAPESGSHQVTLVSGQVVSDTDFGLQQVDGVGNLAPSIRSEAPTQSTSGAVYWYNVVAADPDGDSLTFDLAVHPAGMALDGALGVVVWTPTREQVGIHEVLLRVRDDRGGVDLQAFQIHVSDNSPPLITSTPPGPAAAGHPYRYGVRAQDADGDALLYRLDSAPAGMILDAATGVLDWPTPTAGTHPVTIVVADARGAVATQAFNLQVVVDAPNDPPVIVSTPRELATIGRLYRYRVDAVDPNRDPLIFSLGTAPAGMSISPSGLVDWVPTGTQLGSHAVSLLIDDGRGGSVAQDFSIRVLAEVANEPPVIVSNPPMRVIAGDMYRYDARGDDPDGDPLLWLLESAPAGMSIDVETGRVRWTPRADQLGPHAVVVSLLDGQGGSSRQSFTVQVAAINRPPLITSTPVTVAATDAPFTYAVRATDPDGDRLNYAFFGPPAMSIDPSTGLVRWTPTAADVGIHEIYVLVSDGQMTATQVFDLDVDVSDTAANGSPVITSVPPAHATVEQTYSYRVTAIDPENDPITYRLDAAPSGMTIDGSSGLLTWTPTLAQTAAPQQVVIVASDGQGGMGWQSFTLTPPVNTPPVITSTVPTTATPGALYRYDVRATDPDGDRLSYELVTAPNGMTIDVNGRVRWTPAVGLTGTVPIELRVADGRGGVIGQQGTISLAPDTMAPQVLIQVSANPTPVGQSVMVIASATDNVGVASVALTVGGIPVVLDPNGVGTITPDAVGSLELLAMAQDASGNQGTALVTLSVFDPSDVEAPLVELTSPEDNTIATAPTDIRGTVTDANLLFYTLSLAPIGSDTFVEIARGTSPVTNGLLGRLDTSTLVNDSYTLRLRAVDAGGGESIDERLVHVAGNLKVGNFTLSFTDLTIPVSGVPITVSRTYDSFKAGQHDELGYGWRLEIRDTDLRTSVPRTGMEDYLIYNAFYDGARVYVTLPGGRREGFTFRPQQAAGYKGSFLGIFYPQFVPDAGVSSQLSVPRFDLFVTDDGQLIDAGGGLPYNPSNTAFGGRYVVTTNDGLAYEIDGDSGDLVTVTDTNDNTLTFTDDGIISSTGKSVTFERDPQGRIAAVLDPAGNRIRYEYDVHGDLTAVTDRQGNATRFEYRTDRLHYLDKVIDPLGRTGVRSEYDDKGRLARLFDADGQAVEMLHDPDHFVETVKDQLGNSTVYEYDTLGNVVREVDALGGVTLRTYSDPNDPMLETSVTDPLGNTTFYTYDNRGNQLTETDPLGNVTLSTYQYISFGTSILAKITGQAALPFSVPRTTTDPLGNTTTNAYDHRGRLLSTTDASGIVTAFAYDLYGNPTSLEFAGSTTAFEYDSVGQVLRQIDALGNATTYTYDANGNQLTATTTLTTPTGVRTLVTTTEYDASGRVIKVTDAEGGISRTEYDSAGNRTASIDALGRRTEYRYDERGMLIETIFPDSTPNDLTDNPRTRTEYDAAGREMAAIDEEGRRTEMQYDALGRLVATVYPDATPSDPLDNPRTVTEYDAAGRVKAQIDERGNRTEYEYDAAGRQVVVRNALLHETVTVYDTAGRQVAATDALNHTTRFSYDAGGRKVETIYHDGTKTTNGYDSSGRLVSRTDQLNRTTRYEYDAAGRLTAVLDALGQRTVYGYDEAGNLVTQQDANQHVTRYEYDGLGRRVATELPLGQRSATEYDLVGNLVSSTDFNGDTINYVYDARNQLLSQLYPDGTSVTYTYNLAGQRETYGDARGTTTWAYDERDRLLSRTDSDGIAISYTYDVAGNRTSLTTLAGTVTYAFDALNRLETVTDPESGVTRYQYNPVGNLVRTDLPNGTSETRQYDDLNRLVFLQNLGPSGSISSYRYTLAATGRRDSVLEADGRQVEYDYDALDRLTHEQITDAVFGNRTIDYTYDPVGNRLTRDDTAEGVTDYTYDDNDRLLTETLAAEITQYTYDGNGNTHSKISAADRVFYDWDFENRLIAADTDGDGTWDVTNQYDADGIRVSQTVSGEETRFLIDTVQPFQQVVAEYTPNGILKVSYVHGLDLISQNRPADTGNSFYHVDGLGSTRALTNALGVVADRYIYDAFGRTIGQVGSTGNVHLFAGEQRDVATGLDYLRARWMDTGSGKFVSRDRFHGLLRQPLTLHKYLYANASPPSVTDPTGYFGLLAVLAATAVHSTLTASPTTFSPAAVGGTYDRLAVLQAIIMTDTAINSLNIYRAGFGLEPFGQGFTGEHAPYGKPATVFDYLSPDHQERAWVTFLAIRRALQTPPLFALGNPADFKDGEPPDAYVFYGGRVEVFLLEGWRRLPLSRKAALLVHEMAHEVDEHIDANHWTNKPIYNAYAYQNYVLELFGFEPVRQPKPEPPR
ncbi:MAG: putative Ig domain-containing protein [Pirellulaceae bacterium]